MCNFKVTSYSEVRTKGHDHGAEFPVIQINDCKGCNMVALPQVAIMYGRFVLLQTASIGAPQSMYV